MVLKNYLQLENSPLHITEAQAPLTHIHRAPVNTQCVVATHPCRSILIGRFGNVRKTEKFLCSYSSFLFSNLLFQDVDLENEHMPSMNAALVQCQISQPKADMQENRLVKICLSNNNNNIV